MAATAAFSFASLAKALPSSNVGSSKSSFKGSRLSCGSVKSAPCVRYRPLETSMMAKREQEVEELRKMSDQELKDNVLELKGELLVLRMKRVARQEIKSSEFVRMRKRIARMLTIYRERELEQGITKRASRKLDRAWKKSIVYKPPPSLIARMLTIYRERELEQGITKRASRKLDRAWKKSIVYKPPPSLVAIMEDKKKEQA